MFFRVIFAAILGGGLVFATGAAEHMVLNWVDRTMLKPAEPESLKADLRKHFPQPGVYASLKKSDKRMLDMSKEEQDAHNAEFKEGPSALVIMAPTGEDMMGPKQLQYQGGADVLAALVAAVIISLTRPGIGFIGRWLIVILMGVFCWLSVSAPYFVWYRFSFPFVQDELFCLLLRWAVGGFIIAAIVKPRERMLGY